MPHPRAAPASRGPRRGGSASPPGAEAPQCRALVPSLAEASPPRRRTLAPSLAEASPPRVGPPPGADAGSPRLWSGRTLTATGLVRRAVAHAADFEARWIRPGYGTKRRRAAPPAAEAGAPATPPKRPRARARAATPARRSGAAPRRGRSRAARNLPALAELRAPAAIGAPVAPPFWRFSPDPAAPGAAALAAAALDAWRREAARGAAAARAGRGPRARRLVEGATILYGWNATSGRDRGWFPAVVTRPAADADDAALNFEIYSGPRGAAGPAFPAASVGAINGAVDVALVPAEYGTKWVILEDRRPPRGDGFLAAPAARAAPPPAARLSDGALRDALARCGGHEPSFTLNLGFVARGDNGGVAVDTRRWARLLGLLLAYFDAHCPDRGARVTSVYVNFAAPGAARRRRARAPGARAPSGGRPPRGARPRAPARPGGSRARRAGRARPAHARGPRRPVERRALLPRRLRELRRRPPPRARPRARALRRVAGREPRARGLALLPVRRGPGDARRRALRRPPHRRLLLRAPLRRPLRRGARGARGPRLPAPLARTTMPRSGRRRARRARRDGGTERRRSVQKLRESVAVAASGGRSRGTARAAVGVRAVSTVSGTLEPRGSPFVSSMSCARRGHGSRSASGGRPGANSRRYETISWSPRRRRSPVGSRPAAPEGAPGLRGDPTGARGGAGGAGTSRRGARGPAPARPAAARRDRDGFA